MLYVLAGLMIPYPARALPLYEMMTSPHLTGNLTSVILFQAGSPLLLVGGSNQETVPIKNYSFV
jgi:ABC-type glycerol-3-phosphate transport system permease component